MRFWRGLMWGGLLGSAIGFVLSSNEPQRKPMIVRQIQSTAKDVVKTARKARRRMIDRF
jgi:hypothetical protein